MHMMKLLALPIAIAVTGSAAHAQDEAAPGEIEVPEPPKWERSLDFGLSGASGNTDTQDILAAFNAHKATDRDTIDFTAVYRKSESNSNDTANRFFTQGRYTWLFEDSKWGLFADASLEIDRFQDWDQRIAAHVGPSYRIIDNDKTFLEARAGIGAVGTFGGNQDDEVSPEGLLGASFRHTFNDKWSMVANAEYLPNLEESGYRFLGDAAIEYSLADEWSLKAGIRDVFDSEAAPGFDDNDFYYFVALAAKF